VKRIEIEETVEPHEVEQDISLEQVKARTVRGIAIVTGRGLILNLIAQTAFIFLLAFLNQDQIGTFWIITAAVSFVTYFSDIGLAAALIQKKDKVTEVELRTTFTVQQFLVISLLVIILLLSPSIVSTYKLTSEGQVLLYAISASLFFASLKSIPTILLERKLEFGKMAVPDLVEALVYNLVLVTLAWKGMGITSFTYAVLARGIIGVLVMYWISPWTPGFAFSKSALGGLFKFGVPYQFNTFLSVLKDQGVTLILGSLLGVGGVGILNTAQKFSQLPLRLFMDSVTKVTFPAFSRMQDLKNELGHAVTRSMLFLTFLVFPLLMGFLVLAPVLIDIFPKYDHWRPALLPLFFMSINSFFATFTTLLTNTLSAVGKIKTVSKLIIMWTVATLLFVPALSYYYGVVGAAQGYALVGALSIVAVWIAKKTINFSLMEGVYKTLVASLIMGGTLMTLRILLPHNVASLVVMILTGSAVYGLTCLFLIGPTLLNDVKRIVGNALSR